MAFIADAALGVVVDELLKLVIKVGKQTLNFKSNFKVLENTLKSITPIFREIEKLNRILDRPKEETAQFIDQLDGAKKLVAKCSKIQWWEAYKLYVYSKKLEELDKSIVRFFSIEVQGFVAVTSLKAVVGIKEVNEKLDLILDRSNISVSGVSSWGTVPGLRDQVIGFDEPLKDLKKMLLKDKKTVTLISAPGGCGKTTLAKMLCQDPEIKGETSSTYCITFVCVCDMLFCTWLLT